MKKITSVILLCVLCLPVYCACSNKEAPLTERFASKSAIAGLLSGYMQSVSKNLLLPSSDAAVESDVEYDYKTEDGTQTAHKTLDAAFKAETKTLQIKIGEHTFSADGALSADGTSVRSITDKADIQKVMDVFVKTFCTYADSGDYAEATDSIRAADDDVEVNRITLKMSGEKSKKALAAAVDAVLENKDTKRYLMDLCGFYGYLHNREDDAEKLLSDAADSFKASANQGESLVWQRYLRDGEAVAARMKYGDNLIRYLIAETDNYTELDFEAKINGRELTASYLMRRTGMSDSYNIRIAYGNEITYFDGLAESAYKSGKIKFELRAAQDAETVNGAYLELDFNGVNKLNYKGSGNVVVNREKKTYTFDFTFSDAAALPEIQTATGDEALYEAVERIIKIKN